MQIYKVLWRDGTTTHVWAESSHQVRFSIYAAKRLEIVSILAVVRDVCDDRTNPWAWSGVAGHRGIMELATV